MRQLLQTPDSGEIRLEEVPVPVPGPGQVLVRVRFSAVSVGTERKVLEFSKLSILGKAKARPDLVRRTLEKAGREGLLPTLEAAAARLSSPMPLGYSCSGVVEEVGSGVSRFAPGDQVACGGAGYANHADFVCVPENLCAPARAGSLEEAAFATLATIPLNALRLAGTQTGEWVAVVGLGLMGQLAAQLARLAGLRVLGVDLDASRVELARSLGAEAALLRADAAEAALSLTGGRGVDAVLIAADSSSSDAVELAGELARDRGRVVAIGAVGLSVPRDLYYRKELSLTVARSYGPGRYDPDYEEGGRDYPYAFVRWTEGRNLEEAARLLSTGALRAAPLITHRFPLERAAEAYQLISAAPRRPFLGVVLSYGEEASVSRRVPVCAERAAGGAAQGVGVLGAGQFAAAVALPAVKRCGARLRGIASAGGARATAAARRFGFAFAASDPAEVLKDPETGAVLILTRHGLHADQVCAALEAGKHVFVEKPLCLLPEELARIAKARERRPDRLLQVGFNRRFAPFTARLRAFFAGAAGPKTILARVQAGELAPGHWLLDAKEGGGRLAGEGCHFIDWCNHVAGARPLEADCRRIGEKAGEQEWSLRLSYPDGSLADIVYIVSGHGALGKERYEVHAGGRSAVLEDFSRLRLCGPRGTRTSRAWLRADKGHAAQWEAFLRCAARGGPAPVPWQDVVDAAETVFAAQRSLRQGRPERVER
jgi:predicted dehydrogenase